MSNVTGIELGPNYCVLTRSARRGSQTFVSAASRIGHEEWTGDPEALVDILRAARRRGRMPVQARVVWWRATETQTHVSVAQLPELSPLVAAGFEIESVLSPADALGRLVRDRQVNTDGHAVAAIALNSCGVVIAIVSRGRVISSRAFPWALGTPFTGRRREQLDRCLVISEVAPQLAHLIELVRPVYGARVGSAVVCGNLPNLRSVSMLLIEELDIEVETLDSTDLLADDSGQPLESVPALLLACAASSEEVARLPDPPPRPQSPVPGSGSSSSWSAGRHAIGIVAFALTAAWASMQLSGMSPAVPMLADGSVVAAAPAMPELRAEASIGRVGETPPKLPEPVEEPSAVPTSSAPPRQTNPPSRAPSPPAPLPRVDGIVIAGERRLAIVDGAVVAPGDAVGARFVSKIQRDGVYLRNADGREVFVPIRAPRRQPDGS